MARLFIGNREQQFMADIAKEFMKDVVGQVAYLFPVSTLKTQIHPVYEEAIKKIYENPVKIEVLADQVERGSSNSNFGLDRETRVKIWFHNRDLIDKDLRIFAGDFILYGDTFYEIESINLKQNIYGQEDHIVSWESSCRVARIGQADIAQFDLMLRDAKHFKYSQVQKEFEQQRGYKKTEHEGSTGDVRQMRERLKGEMAPIALGEGPREIVQDEDENSNSFEHSSHTLYDEF